MRKSLVALPLVLLLSGIALAITEKQATVIPVLEQLKCERVPSRVIGGPQKFKVSKATVELLTRLLEKGGTLTVENDGSVKIDEPGQ